MARHVKPIRQENLRRLIDRDFGGNQSAIARVYNPQDPKPQYFSDLLAGRKSFGEKAAEKIERRVGLVEGSLSQPGGPLLRDPSRPMSYRDQLRSLLETLSESQAKALVQAVEHAKSRPRKGNDPLLPPPDHR